MLTKQAVNVDCNNAARSGNHYCHKIASEPLCIVDLHVAVNNIKVLIVAVKMQKCVCLHCKFALFVTYAKEHRTYSYENNKVKEVGTN